VIPSEKEIAKLIEAVQTIEEAVKKYTVLLKTEERIGTTKMRTGGAKIVGDIAGLADEHGLTLPKISTAGMLADLLLSQRLRPLAAAVTKLAQRLDDTELEAESECWWAATAFYTSLARMAGADATLALALEPIISFFAVGRRKPKQ
jgi:hypothetical protein